MAAIRIDTSINTEGLRKGWQDIEKNVRKTEDAFGGMGNSISKSFAETTSAIMKQQIAVSELAKRLKEVQSIEAQRTSYEDKVKEVDKLVKEFGDLSEKATLARVELGKMEFPNQPKESSEELTLKLGLANKKLGEMKEQSASSGKSVEKSNSKMGDSFSKLLTKIKNLVLTVAVFQLMRNAIRGLTQGLGNALMQNETFSNSLNAIKVNLLTAFAPIWETIQPILLSFMKVLQQVTYYAAQFVATLFGKTLAQAKSSAKALYGQAKAIDKVKKAADSANSSLDELIFINKDLDETVDDTSEIDFSELTDFTPNAKIEGFFNNISKAIEYLKPLLTDLYNNFINLDIGLQLGLLITLGGLVALLFGATGLGFALIGVGLLIIGLTELFNGDFNESIEGIILTIGAAGLLGVLWGKGGLGFVLGEIIVIVSGLSDIFHGDFLEGINKIILGGTSLIATLSIMKTGFGALNVPLLITLGAVAALSLGITSLINNWGSMTPLQRAISILGSLAAAAVAAAIAIAIFHTAWSVGIAAAAIAAGLALLATSQYFSKGAINSAQASASPTSLSTAQSFGAMNFSANPLPKLATGNVFMPNKEMAFIAGDHPTQREILAPEDVIRQIVREESGSSTSQAELTLMEEQNELLRAILNKTGFTLDGRDLMTSVENAQANRGIVTGGGAFKNVY